MTGMATKSAPRLTAAKEICLIRNCMLLQIVTNNGLFHGLERLFDIHRSQEQRRTDQDCDEQD